MATRRKRKPAKKETQRSPVERLDYEYVRAFVERDWGAPERLRLEQAAAEYRRLGPAWYLAQAEKIRLFIQRVHPDRPSAADRLADLAHHVKMHELLARTAQLR